MQVPNVVYPSLPDFVGFDHKFLVRVIRKTYAYLHDPVPYLNQLDDVIAVLPYFEAGKQLFAARDLFALMDLFSSCRGDERYDRFVLAATKWLEENFVTRQGSGYRRVRPLKLSRSR